MLAPLRDYPPKYPKLSLLLCPTKEHHLGRLAVEVYPDGPEYERARLITSEDTNAKHLLDVFTSIDINSTDARNGCRNFVDHLYWHKPQLAVLGSQIEGLLDDHPSKPVCPFGLSQLFHSVGNYVEERRLLIHVLRHHKEYGDGSRVAETSLFLGGTNCLLGLHEEGISQKRHRKFTHCTM